MAKYKEELANEIIDPNLIEIAYEICSQYFLNNPEITLENAQQAAIILMTALRLTDKKIGMHSAQDIIVIEWLTKLKINLETLEITK